MGVPKRDRNLELFEKFKRGVSIKQLAKEYGICYGAANSLCNKMARNGRIDLGMTLRNWQKQEAEGMTDYSEEYW